MRCHHRQRQLGGQLHRIAQMHLFARRAVALHFQIETVGEQPGIFLRDDFRARRIAVHQRRPDFAQVRPGQGDQPIRSRAQPLLAYLGTTAILVLQIGLRDQLAQAQITRVGLAQQQQTVGLVAHRVIGHEHVAADDGLDARAARLLVKLDQPEHIGQGQ